MVLVVVRWRSDLQRELSSLERNVQSASCLRREMNDQVPVTDTQTLEQRYRELLEIIPHGIEENDLEGTIVFSSPANDQLHGFPIGGMAGKKIWDFLERQEDRDALRELFRHLIAEQPPPTPFVGRDITPDGRVVIVQVDWTYKRDASGRVTGFVSVITDITRRQQAEDALRESEERYRSVISAMSEGVVVQNEAGQIVAANPAAERILGLRFDQMRGLTSFDPRWQAIHENGEPFRAETRPMVISLRTGKPLFGVIMGVYSASRELRWLLVNTVPLFHPGSERPYAVVATFKDITDRRRAEEQSRRHQAELAHVSRLTSLGEMAAGIAHEINQPLYAIANYADACRQAILRSQNGVTPEFLSWVEQISLQTQRAGEIIRRMVDFVRKSPPRCEAVILPAVIRDSIGLIDHELKEHRIEMQVQLSEDLPLVRFDRQLIEQVLVNLLRNASEALQGQPHPRRICVTGQRASPGTVEIAVTDNGCGVTEDQMERLFEPFFTTKPQGLGIGLSLSRSLLEAQDGGLMVSRNADRGMTFRVKLQSM